MIVLPGGEQMKLSTVFILNAIVTLVYGIAFILAPLMVLSIYGITQGPGAVMMGRYFGSAAISIGLVAWFARNSGESEARRAIVLGLFISFIIGLLVSAHGTLSGAMSAVGWTAVLLYLFFVLSYGYFLFVNQETAASE
jgi:hypothetical protein